MSTPNIIKYAKTSKHFCKLDEKNHVEIDGACYVYQSELDRFVKISHLPTLEKEDREYFQASKKKLLDKMEKAKEGYY